MLFSDVIADIAALAGRGMGKAAALPSVYEMGSSRQIEDLLVVSPVSLLESDFFFAVGNLAFVNRARFPPFPRKISFHPAENTKV